VYVRICIMCVCRVYVHICIMCVCVFACVCVCVCVCVCERERERERESNIIKLFHYIAMLLRDRDLKENWFILFSN